MATTTGSRSERGQSSLLMVVVLAITIAAALAIAVIGQAMVHRARARTAADAIALASAANDAAGVELATWYQSQGVTSDVTPGRAWAGSGPSQAAAWAKVEPAPVETAPVLRAIVARIEQLRGHTFTTVLWRETWFELGDADARVLQSMASEFGLCGRATVTGWRFERC